MTERQLDRAKLLSYGLVMALSFVLSFFPVNIEDSGTADDGDDSMLAARHSLLLPLVTSHTGATLVLTFIATALLTLFCAILLAAVHLWRIIDTPIAPVLLGNARAPPRRRVTSVRY